jgi:hypothetical protein
LCSKIIEETKGAEENLEAERRVQQNSESGVPIPLETQPEPRQMHQTIGGSGLSAEINQSTSNTRVVRSKLQMQIRYINQQPGEEVSLINSIRRGQFGRPFDSQYISPNGAYFSGNEIHILPSHRPHDLKELGQSRDVDEGEDESEGENEPDGESSQNQAP